MNIGRTAGSAKFLSSLNPSGAVGKAGTAKRVYCVTITNTDDTTEGNAFLYNGLSASDTLYVQETVPIGSFGESFDYGENGFFFPNGLFVNITVNAIAVTVAYSEEP